MNIFLCYDYRPETTAVYFERALRRDHNVVYVGPGYGPKPGYAANADLSELIAGGVPQPDLVLFIEPGIRFFPRGLERMTCPTACYLIDVHQNIKVRERYAPFFDYVFVAQRDYVDHFRKLGHRRVEWLPLACDPEIHGARVEEEVYDIGFIGNPAYSSDRRRRLELLEREFKINNWRRYYSKEEIAEVYSKSRTVFNNAVKNDLNMRVFEALASGKLLITNRIGNGQDDLFTDGTHLALYDDDESLLKVMRTYLGDDQRRLEVARAGTAEVLAKHTYQHRAETILSTIFSGAGPSLQAKAREIAPDKLRIAYADMYARMRIVDPVLDELDAAWANREWKGMVTLTFKLLRGLLMRFNSQTKVTIQLKNGLAALRPGKRASANGTPPKTSI